MTVIPGGSFIIMNFASSEPDSVRLSDVPAYRTRIPLWRRHLRQKA